MDQIHYIISTAAKELHVEPHVLRYWEEELCLHIPRNKMGHRLYGPKEMELFRKILNWKKDGLSLKEIQQKCNPSPLIPLHDQGAVSSAPSLTPVTHQVIPYPVDAAPSIQTSFSAEAEMEESDQRMQQFKQILGRIVSDAIHDNSEELTTEISSNVSANINKELDFLFREREEADEKRYRHLDETLRGFQKARQEAAAAIEEEKTKKRHRFSKK